ncbi:hypothetical protein [Stella sp.]|uniref:hypothetical protein n=1 Tax=Stella sp. TaxID=2912054 RepID=UPI0035ADF1CB
MRRSLALLALLVAAAPAAAQKPDAVIAALRGRPATLLDLSLARLQAFVDDTGRPLGFGGFAALQEGRIVVFAYAEEDPATEARCRTIVAELKRAAAVHPDTGEPYRPASAWASLFSYPGLDQFAIDPSWDETVDAMFEIRVTVGVTGDGKGVVCRSPLLGREVTVRRE